MCRTYGARFFAEPTQRLPLQRASAARVTLGSLWPRLRRWSVVGGCGCRVLPCFGFLPLGYGGVNEIFPDLRARRKSLSTRKDQNSDFRKNSLRQHGNG